MWGCVMKLARPMVAQMRMTLPGPDRWRSPTDYQYTVTYRSPDGKIPGSLMTWQVDGGRLSYQVVLELTDSGQRKWHCTCADAIYRGSPEHECKHVQALRAVVPS